MRRSAISLLLLTIHVVHGQLNYEGNPLTEDTVYTAEESHVDENTAEARALEPPGMEDSYLLAVKSLEAERSHNRLYRSNDIGAKNGAQLPSRDYAFAAGNSYNTIPDEVLKKSPAPLEDAVVSTQTDETSYNEATERQPQAYAVDLAEPSTPQVSHTSDAALTMFLNSKTPQESRMALDEYLNGGETATRTADESPYQPHVSDIVLPQRELVNVNQQPSEVVRQDARYLQPANLEHIGQQSTQSFPPNRQIVRNVGFAGRKNPFVIREPSSPFGKRSYAVRFPYKSPIYRPQPRIGAGPAYVKGPHGPGHDGLEVIYTKPPGYGKSQYFRSQNPQADASAWFPDADHPPPDMDIYYSQLYAQSYDPHYYNYIAKYGKIKPYLYGKFEKKEESIWWELFQNFKKHGMKHVMHPMFLLGMGIPMITLMLSALVNNRSFARSNSGIGNDARITDEDIDEWTTKLRRALDCYTKLSSESERSKCAVWD